MKRACRLLRFRYVRQIKAPLGLRHCSERVCEDNGDGEGTWLTDLAVLQVNEDQNNLLRLLAVGDAARRRNGMKIRLRGRRPGTKS
jgi:hypothetical protein